MMNFVLGFVVLLMLVITSGKLGSTTVAQFTGNAQSCADGLREGDTILKVDDQVCRTIGDLSGCFDGTTQTHDFTVLRNGQVVHLPGVTVGPSTDADGNTIAIDFRVAALSKTPRHVLQRTGTLFRYYSTAILGGFWQLATGQVGVEELSAPSAPPPPLARPSSTAGKMCSRCSRLSPSISASLTCCLSRHWTAAS